jgi:hypothetical protein
MEDSGIDSDPKAINHVEDERLFLVNVHYNDLYTYIIKYRGLVKDMIIIYT